MKFAALCSALLAVASAVSAQDPMTVPLRNVQRVFVMPHENAEGFDLLLKESLRTWGKVEVVSSAKDHHEIVLAATYGCSPYSFRFRQVSRSVGWSVCYVFAMDSDLLKRDISHDPVWEMPIGMLMELATPPGTMQTIAQGVVDQLRKDWELSAGLREPDPTPTLLNVQSIYVATGDFSALENVAFEELIWWKMVRTKKDDPVGTCDTGYQSRIAGVSLRCFPWEADAILVSGDLSEAGRRIRIDSTGSSHTTGTERGTISASSRTYGGVVWTDDTYRGQSEQTTTLSHSSSIVEDRFTQAGAVLIHRRTGEILWETNKDDFNRWAEFFARLGGGSGAPPSGVFKIASRIANQLKKDIEKEQKAKR